MLRKLISAGVLGLLLCLISCQGSASAAAVPVAAETVLASMQAAVETTCPSGRVYSRAAPPETANYLGDTLLSALYGDGARGMLAATGTSPAVNDAALFLSIAPHPMELAVFRCSDARASATAAKLCRSRLERIRHAWKGSEWEEMTARACVTVAGEYVLLVVSEDPEAVIRAAEKAIWRGT